jgi:hypothetical protein
MGKDQRQQGRNLASHRRQRSQQRSTSISSSFPGTDLQHKDRDSLMNEITNNNKRSK